MIGEEITIHSTIWKLHPDHTVFKFVSSLGIVLAEGRIHIKDIPKLKEFRQNSKYTEVLIFDKKKDKLVRADEYEVE